MTVSAIEGLLIFCVIVLIGYAYMLTLMALRLKRDMQRIVDEIEHLERQRVLMYNAARASERRSEH